MFAYHGNVERLSEALNKGRTELERAYRTVLGNDLFEIMEAAANALVDKESFLGEWPMEGFAASSLRQASRFLPAFAGDLKSHLTETGEIVRADRIITAPVFVFTNTGFEARAEQFTSWAPTDLAPYIHEWNHFFFYSIQPYPMEVAFALLVSQVRPAALPLQLQDIAELVRARKGSQEEKISLIRLATMLFQFDRRIENTARRLDGAILAELGYIAPTWYFDVLNEKVVDLQIPEFGTVRVVFRDLPLNMSIQRIIGIFAHWTDNWQVVDPFEGNFVQSMTRLDIYKVPYSKLK